MAETDIEEKEVECGFEQKTRFPEFLGAEVRLVSLSDVTEEVKVRNGQKHSAASVMGVSKVDGIVPMEARLIASDIARYKVVEHNSFAYNPMRLNIGSIARWNGGSEILVSPDYVVFKCVSKHDHGLIPEYLDHFRQTKAWESFVAKGGDGGVRVRIYYKDLAQLRLAVPSISEQQRIADCLTSIDELIAAQARKVDALKTHKQGLMQQLFPREGEIKPRLRFTEFESIAGWEHRKLGNICEIQRGKFAHRPRNDPRFFGGPYPFIQTGDVVKSEGGAVAASQSLNEDGLAVSRLFKPTIVLITIAANIGDTGLLKMEGCFTDSVAGLIPKTEVIPVFLELIMRGKKEYLNKVATTGAQKNINKEILRDVNVLLPSLPEQQRIADCLNSVDNLVTSEIEKLEALKTHKRGLMQQLFPSMVAATP
jgi:type I restriction enzyme S subunit